MHGLVDEKNVNYLMVQKAILAYSFFVQLYVLKTKNSKKARIKSLRRKGISRVSKSQRRFYANESRNLRYCKRIILSRDRRGILGF